MEIDARGSEKSLSFCYLKIDNIFCVSRLTREGSGNFLMLAYRELRRLEHEVVSEVLIQEWKQDNRGTMGAEYQDTLLTIEDRIIVEVSQFYGVELQPYAASIAKLGLWLIDHLMNMEASNKFGQYFVRLPLHAGANIYVDNALKVDWKDIVPVTKLSYILGNPPFIGHNAKSVDNQKELKSVAPKWKGISNLDYVSGWFIKASKMMEYNPLIETAFVSTNSIAQGTQAINLFSELFNKGFNINFAHQTFEWDNNGAKVHVIITGFSKIKKKQRKLYKYSSLKAEAQLVEVSNINEYLLPMKSVKLTAMYKQISGKPDMIYGSNMSTGTALMFKEKEYQEFIRKIPWTKEYMRPLIGAKELTNNFKRYVLYLKDAKPSLINSTNEVLERLNKVKSDRKNSKDILANQMVDTPTLLYSDRVLDGDFLVIPIVTSGNREYVPIIFEKYPTIATNKTFQLPNADKYIFGILESRMHMCWMKVTVGRLKSDYSYSNTLVYNTFVFPETNKTQEETVANLVDNVLTIREKYFKIGEKIKDLYSKLMPPDLRKAHNKLDREVEKLYRKQPFNSDEDRFEYLLKLYRREIEKF
ncbi:DNA methyltransferase [Enterococcus saigonensis]